ncbi:phage integrase SAM-like domain-containing protein [Runella sp.]|uniref:site-specific integrase n=1 Tax=Runella sp. TaxID=1960881 RepID=UPI00301AA0E0
MFLENKKGNISVEDFRQELKVRLGEPEREAEETEEPEIQHIDFLDFIEQYYQERKGQPNAKAGTLKFIHKIKVHIQDYAKDRRRKIEFADLNDKFFSDLRDWLHSPPRLHSTNYVQKIFQYVKLFVRRAETRGLHNSRAYQDFKLPKTPITKIVLSFEQLEHLAQIDLSDNQRLEKVRDLFLIGSYTGLRFSDFTRIQPEHIQDHEGERLIHITTQKTEQSVIIPLHKTLDEVLKKYGYKSPSMSNQKMNDYLKELGQLAGFTKEIIVNDATGGIHTEKKVPMWEMLTTHVARRSFATNFYQKYPEQIDRIMKITGHTTEKMFRAYIVTDALNSAIDFGKAISKP